MYVVHEYTHHINTHLGGGRQIYPINYVSLHGNMCNFSSPCSSIFSKNNSMNWRLHVCCLYSKMTYYFKIYLTYNSNSAINVLVWVFLALMFKKKKVNYSLLSSPNAHKSVFFFTSKIPTTPKVPNNFLFFLRFPCYFFFFYNVFRNIF